MPITRKQFELGINSRIEGWMKRIHSFLAEHKDEAFNADELKEELHPRPRNVEEAKEKSAYLENYSVDDGAIDLALEKLAQLRAAEERVISGISYYVYRGPLVLDDSEQRLPF